MGGGGMCHNQGGSTAQARLNATRERGLELSLARDMEALEKLLESSTKGRVLVVRAA